MATAEKTWRTKKTIQELASLLRDSGESREKLSQKRLVAGHNFNLLTLLLARGYITSS